MGVSMQVSDLVGKESWRKERILKDDKDLDSVVVDKLATDPAKGVRILSVQHPKITQDGLWKVVTKSAGKPRRSRRGDSPTQKNCVNCGSIIGMKFINKRKFLNLANMVDHGVAVLMNNASKKFFIIWYRNPH